MKLFLSLTRRKFKAAFSHMEESSGGSSVIKFMDQALRGMFISLLMWLMLYEFPQDCLNRASSRIALKHQSKRRYVKLVIQSARKDINFCTNLTRR